MPSLRFRGVFGAFIVASALGAATVAAHDVAPFAYPQPESAPAEFVALIEIPQGSFSKYELDPETGYLVVDRFQSMPVVYPANYGSVPSSQGDDGDPLDVLVLSREPIVPGAFIHVRPLGVLRMIDGGEPDDKIVAVPTSKVDPYYSRLRDISDLPAIERDRIEAFFRVYKLLPAGRKKVELSGFGDRELAEQMLRAAMGIETDR